MPSSAIKGLYAKRSVTAQLLILLAIIFGCTLLAIIPSALLIFFAPNHSDPAVLRTTIFIQDLFVFILASYFGQYLFFEEPTHDALGLHCPSWMAVLLGVIAITCLSPLTDILTNWNKQMQFPEALSWLFQWMQSSEEQAASIITSMLNTHSWITFITDLLIIGVMAGLSEELLFRGVLQKILIRGFHNPHLGIFVAAFIFSAIHLQFLGFVPRLVLGMLLGYLYYLSGSIWVPVIAHAVNNICALLLTPSTMNEHWQWAKEMYNMNFSTATSVIATLITIGSIAILYKRHKQSI